MSQFCITGHIIDPRTHKRVSGLWVEAWDKDLIFDDLVGSAITDRDGNFQIQFDESYFQEQFLDRKPDLFFKVFDQNKLIKSTEDSVLWNINNANTEITIALPQGETIMREHPTQFDLQGDDTQIIYSTTSFSGVPQLSYQDQQRNLQFSDDEIRILETEIGSLVTVTLEATPDLQTVTLSLLLPTINLLQDTRESPVETIAILTTKSTSIGGPDLIEGQLETYCTIMLKGTARLINF